MNRLLWFSLTRKYLRTKKFLLQTVTKLDVQKTIRQQFECIQDAIKNGLDVGAIVRDIVPIWVRLYQGNVMLYSPKTRKYYYLQEAWSVSEKKKRLIC